MDLVHGILQARILQWVAFPFSRGSSQPRDQIANICCIIEKKRAFQKNIYLCFINYAKDFDWVDHNKMWKTLSEVKVAQLCLTLCDPMDYTVHGILQARILEWLAFPFSKGSSQPRDRNQVPHILGGVFNS